MCVCLRKLEEDPDNFRAKEALRIRKYVWTKVWTFETRSHSFIFQLAIELERRAKMSLRTA